ncbi:MAG: zinc ribbon domain-containing protein [Bacilli bacterium]
MKCSKCGNEVKDDEKFCSNCGSKIRKISNVEIIKNIVFIVFFGIAICCCFCLLFTRFMVGSSDVYFHNESFIDFCKQLSSVFSATSDGSSIIEEYLTMGRFEYCFLVVAGSIFLIIVVVNSIVGIVRAILNLCGVKKYDLFKTSMEICKTYMAYAIVIGAFSSLEVVLEMKDGTTNQYLFDIAYVDIYGASLLGGVINCVAIYIFNSVFKVIDSRKVSGKVFVSNLMTTIISSIVYLSILSMPLAFFTFVKTSEDVTFNLYGLLSGYNYLSNYQITIAVFGLIGIFSINEILFNNIRNVYYYGKKKIFPSLQIFTSGVALTFIVVALILLAVYSGVSTTNSSNFLTFGPGLIVALVCGCLILGMNIANKYLLAKQK